MFARGYVFEFRVALLRNTKGANRVLIGKPRLYASERRDLVGGTQSQEQGPSLPMVLWCSGPQRIVQALHVAWQAVYDLL